LFHLIYLVLSFILIFYIFKSFILMFFFGFSFKTFNSVNILNFKIINLRFNVIFNHWILLLFCFDILNFKIFILIWLVKVWNSDYCGDNSFLYWLQKRVYRIKFWPIIISNNNHIWRELLGALNVFAGAPNIL